MDKTSNSIRRVEDALRAHGVDTVVTEMPGSTRTAQDAADAVGCAVGQIAKSLVFASESGDLLLAVTSGSNRVDPKRLASFVGEPVELADPNRVRDVTGFAIGGVPPVALPDHIPVYVDRDLLGYSEIWAAAGTPRSVFRITPGELVAITGGEVVSLAV